MAIVKLEDVRKHSECLDRTLRLFDDSSMTAEERVVEIAKLPDCAPRIDWPKADPNEPKEEQERQALEDMITQINERVKNTGWGLVKDALPEFLTPPNLNDVLRDVFGDGQDNENWSGDFATSSPRADDFDPKGFPPESSRNGFTQFTNWVPKPTVTPVSADGSPSGWTFDDIGDWHRWQEWLQSQSSNYLPSKGVEEFLTADSRFRPIQESTLGPNYTLMSPEEWKQAIWHGKRLATTIRSEVNPAMYGLTDSFGETRTAVGELAGTMRSEVTSALGMTSDSAIQSAIAFHGVGESMEGTRQSSSGLAGALPADAAAMGDGVYHGLEPARVGFQGLTGDMSGFFEMALTPRCRT